MASPRATMVRFCSSEKKSGFQLGLENSSDASIPCCAGVNPFSDARAFAANGAKAAQALAKHALWSRSRRVIMGGSKGGLSVTHDPAPNLVYTPKLLPRHSNSGRKNLNESFKSMQCRRRRYSLSMVKSLRPLLRLLAPTSSREDPSCTRSLLAAWISLQAAA